MQQLLAYLIPSSIEKGTDLFRKATILTYTFIIGTGFSFSYIVMCWFLDYSWGAWVNVYTVSSFVVAAFYFKKTGDFHWAGNLFSFTVYINIAVSAFTSGMFSVLLWWVVTPISAYLYANNRSGHFWTIVTTVTIAIFYVGKIFGATYFRYLPEQYMIVGEFLTSLGMFLYIIVIVMIYENERHIMFVKLRAALQEVTAQKDEIGQQNEEIRQQQEEILTINEQLQDKNSLLQEKNNLITDSIRYAKTIQQAMLPSEATRVELLPDSFLLYRPKDIVSGDFYWISESEGHVYLAVVDCTGHGVPGAFMSMIGFAILEEAINVKKLRSPSQILQFLHDTLYTRLSQEDGKNTDGMDMGLCVWNKFGNELVFAGAKNKMYVGKATELLELKGSKFSIGGTFHNDKRQYTDETVAVQSGDKLYLFTDGLSDQSNPKKERFGTNALKAFLADTYSLSIPDQKEALANALDAHQGSESQRDDITVLAVKV